MSSFFPFFLNHIQRICILNTPNLSSKSMNHNMGLTLINCVIKSARFRASQPTAPTAHRIHSGSQLTHRTRTGGPLVLRHVASSQPALLSCALGTALRGPHSRAGRAISFARIRIRISTALALSHISRPQLEKHDPLPFSINKLIKKFSFFLITS